jgi:hypothetical protein
MTICNGIPQHKQLLPPLLNLRECCTTRVNDYLQWHSTAQTINTTLTTNNHNLLVKLNGYGYLCPDFEEECGINQHPVPET